MLEPLPEPSHFDQLISDLDYATLLTLDDLEDLIGRAKLALETVRDDAAAWHDAKTYPPIGNAQHPDFAKEIQILGTITMPEPAQVAFGVGGEGNTPEIAAEVQAQIDVTHWRAA